MSVDEHMLIMFYLHRIISFLALCIGVGWLLHNPRARAWARDAFQTLRQWGGVVDMYMTYGYNRNLYIKQVQQVAVDLPDRAYDLLKNQNYAELHAEREILAPFFEARRKRGDTDMEHIAHAYAELERLSTDEHPSMQLLVPLLVGKNCVGMEGMAKAYVYESEVFRFLVSGRELARLQKEADADCE